MKQIKNKYGELRIQKQCTGNLLVIIHEPLSCTCGKGHYKQISRVFVNPNELIKIIWEEMGNEKT